MIIPSYCFGLAGDLCRKYYFVWFGDELFSVFGSLSYESIFVFVFLFSFFVFVFVFFCFFFFGGGGDFCFTRRENRRDNESAKGAGGGHIPFHAQLVTKFTCHVYLEHKNSRIPLLFSLFSHIMVFFSHYFHASQTNINPYHMTCINPLLPSTTAFQPRNFFASYIVKQERCGGGGEGGWSLGICRAFKVIPLFCIAHPYCARIIVS